MRPATFLAASLALLGSVATASAQTDVEKDEAQRRFDEGLKLHDAGNDGEARLKFTQAWAVLKRPNVLFNLARSEQLSGHPVEALGHFREYVKMPGTSSQDREDAERRTVELKKVVCTVEVRGAPEGAKILIDDAWTGETAPVLGEIHALPGRRVVEARTSARSHRKELACEAQKTAAVSFEDVVRASQPAGGSAGGSPERAAGRIPVSVALGVLGLGGIATGIAFGVASGQKKDDAAKYAAASPGACEPQSSPSCAPVLGARGDQSTFAALSITGYVAGGVLLAGAVAAFVLWPRKKAETPAVGLAVTPAGGALTVHGRF